MIQQGQVGAIFNTITRQDIPVSYTHLDVYKRQTPSRFNADPRRLFEASGCAGKLALFAVRLDTFASESAQQVFYIGTNDTAVLDQLRRHILSCFTNLPVAGEHMHRDAFDIAETLSLIHI